MACCPQEYPKKHVRAFEQALDEVRHPDNDDPTRQEGALLLHHHPLHHRQLPQQNIEVIW